ncbi:MAG: bifunctional 4-hydroxy-2-oxoglutarate aldolase/2-dehydro-3-deoxy-phosphogluconate aldolase [Deferribacteres bacterium]|nr:bifunctional 4-hydroxy-2-oxoglutarate aldolase/2-dehydro-3-deoxy-phosphogluconate aldolase [candidate division KSB1 bacterium]MCB9502182.1 bifunctional 4-hydroxy-2-oxoglutarate aldolase/2-dehydro-3-deoxy-phosphogluconate aldolase [Deferribacteres bacterium]
MSRLAILQKVTTEKAVAVIRMSDSAKLMKVAEALMEGGLSILEITMTTPNALKVIEEATKTFDSGMTIGVGSVLDAETARLAINAGAQYVVSPIFKPEIIHTSHRYDVPAMPGCFSPSEILEAHEQGADIVKVFPADVLGMAFFKAIKAPMPHLNLMPTGGVSLTNAGEWIKAGACAVGIGSALLEKQAIDEGNWNKLKENARLLRSTLDQV